MGEPDATLPELSRSGEAALRALLELGNVARRHQNDVIAGRNIANPWRFLGPGAPRKVLAKDLDGAGCVLGSAAEIKVSRTKELPRCSVVRCG